MKKISGFKPLIIWMAFFGAFMLTTGAMVYVYNPWGFREFGYFIKVGVWFCIPAILWNIPRFFRVLFRRPPVPRNKRRI